MSGVEAIFLVDVFADFALLHLLARQTKLALGQTHASKIADSVLPLVLLSLLVPLELTSLTLLRGSFIAR